MERNPVNGLSLKVRAALVWSIIGEVGVSGFRLLSYLVYAALLKPTDYGVVGFSLPFVQFFLVLTENALPMAVVEAPAGQEEERATLALVSNLCLALLGYLVLYVIAGPASQLIGDPRVATVIDVLGLRLVLSALASTPMAIARRRLEAKTLSYIRIWSTVASLAASAPLAFLGYGYWALVAAMLAGALGQAAAAWLLIPWRANFAFDRQKVLAMYRFAGWTGVDMLLTWGLMVSGPLLLGALAGEDALGKYRLSEQLLAGITGTFLGPLTPMVYGALAEAKRDGQDIKAVLTRLNGVFGIIAIPLCGLLLLLAMPFEGLLKSQWHGIAIILCLNTLTYGLAYLIEGITPFFRAIGKPSAGAVTRLAQVCLQIPVFFLAARLGIIAFLVAKIGLELASMAITSRVLRRTSNIGVWDLIRGQGPLLAITASAAVLCFGAMWLIAAPSNVFNVVLVTALFGGLLLLAGSLSPNSPVAKFRLLLTQMLKARLASRTDR